MKERKFKLVVGDWSGGGHGKTNDFYVLSNAKDTDELKAAYAAGVKVVGVDIEALCKGYEQSVVSVEDFEKIKSKATHGELDMGAGEEFLAQYSDPVNDPPFQENEGGIDLVSYDYFRLWRATARIGNPNLTLSVVNEGIEELDIGGYGTYE